MVAEFKAPIELTDAELDAVAAGAASGLVAVDIHNVLNNNSVANNNSFLNGNDVTVGIPINASAAVAVLGQAITGTTTQAGRIT